MMSISSGYERRFPNVNLNYSELIGLWHGAKLVRMGGVAANRAAAESSTIRPPESTNILRNAATVEARWDTTINVEAER